MSILLLSAVACHYEEGPNCPHEADLYVRTGPAAEDPCECPEGVRLLCSGACVGGDPNGITCEDPARLADFINGPGRDVDISYARYREPGSLYLRCE